jgi:nucleotide-binding universal stress UspA family protein
MKILLAVDGSAGSDAAVDEVARRPWPAGSEVKIISVVELLITPTAENWLVPDSYYLKLEKAGQERARDAIDRAEIELRESNKERSAALTLKSEIISGTPKDVILDEAESWGADLLVLGSHGYRGLKRLWLGSVSQAVATHAKCSVEIVRHS